MRVDDYLYLPRSIASGYEQQQVSRAEPVPFTPLRFPINQSRFALVTTAGIWDTTTDQPFDYAREQREPLWGDPTYRVIPRDFRQERIGAGHLHLNNDDLRADINIALPITRLIELERAREIGSLAPSHYSFMGWQGRGPDGQGNTAAWEQQYAPEVARRMVDEGVHAAVITPT